MQRILQFIGWLTLIFFICLPPLYAISEGAAEPQKQQDEPSIVYDIAQDQQDFLWLASEYDGLLRFDGQHYLKFTPAEQKTNLSFSQLEIDRRNVIWVGTWGHGLWQLDAVRKNWRQVTTPLPPDAQIQSLFTDKAGNLWIGSTQGLFVIKEGAATAELWQPLAGQRIWQLAQQQNGTLWVATSKGLFQLTPHQSNSGHWFNEPILINTEIRALTIQGDLLLLGLRSGLMGLDLNKGSSHYYQSPSNSNVLLQQRENSWLAGTIDGLYSLTLQQGVLHAEPLISAIDIRALFRDSHSTIWLASRNNGLMPMPSPVPKSISPSVRQFLSPTKKHRLGPPSQTSTARWQPLEKSLLQLRHGQWRELEFAAEHKVAFVRDVVEFSGHTLVGTDQGLFRIAADNSMNPLPLGEDAPDLNIERMAVAADGALWLGLWGQGIYRIPAAASADALLPAVQMQQQAPAQEAVIDIQTAPDQKLWLLSRQGSLYQGTASAVVPRWKVPKEMATGYFHCLLAEADAFWLCTDRGLLKLSPDLQQAELLGQSWGLADLRVMGITRSQNFIWVLTRNGLMAFTPDGSAVYLLGPRKELNFRAAQLRGITALGADKVQLATSEGLWQIDISELTAVRKNMQLHLTELRLNQHLYTVADLSQNIQLPADIEELQLKFNLLSYQPHLKVAYFYRWQGQQDWLELGKDAVLTLSQLAPGQHHLQLMAQAGGQQIDTRPVLFSVPMPWWRQPAGILLVLTTLGLLLYLAYHWRVKRLRHHTQHLDHLVKQRTAELEAANQQLRQLSHTDSLTGLMNRRALQYAVSLLQTQRSRTQAPMTLVLMDIDHFKDINDQYGHDIGDAVLVEVARYLQQRLRSQDLLARWGGEEFLLLMPNTEVEQAQQLVDELRLGIRTLSAIPQQVTLTATFGISAVEVTALALEQAIKAADLALYQGKKLGRDQVVLAAASG